VWCPEGCTVSERGEIVGIPRRKGSIWSSQLSGLYSLQRTWGNIAAEWVRLHKHPRERQSFYNSTLAETWSYSKKRTTVEQLGARLNNGQDCGMVPNWAQMLITSVDVQIDHLVWEVCAYDSKERCALIDYGIAEEWEHLENRSDGPMYRTFLREDGKEQRPVGVIIDSGFNTKRVYAFCRRNNSPQLRVLPCKGVDSLSGEPFRKTVVDKDGDKNPENLSTKRGNVLVLISTPYWQAVIQEWIDEPDIEKKFSIPSIASTDTDFLEQLLNEAQIERTNQRTHQPSLIWAKIDETVPNDYRDTLRYNRVMAEIIVRRRWHTLGRRVLGLVKEEAPLKEQSERKKKRNRPSAGGPLFMDRPGGWANFGGSTW
jgi:phage terminase large subunit GpA-like protein